ncbi:MAG: ATP-dependent 6-phosphofructokinase [bacterium]|nr:ATP-dependent 6-phosphofructokinase [bacterium]MBU1917617.1 ATP-dependent 6-phosphofructokinase [bacterium]
MTAKISKIGILTGGGDCPGLNAVIRAVAKTAINDYGIQCIGIKDGFEGLVLNKMIDLSYENVSGILNLGGTILGTSNRADPFNFDIENTGNKQDLSSQAVDNFHKAGLQALMCIGGDGTLSIAYNLMQKGIPCVGVPKTIDNDLFGTDITFGFDSAVHIITEALDRLHTTAQSHHRVMIVETMGRYAGWLALYGGIAGGGDIIIIPEIDYSLETVCERVHERNKKGKRFSIIVISEGVKMPSGDYQIKTRDEGSHDPIRLGGISIWLARKIEKMTGIAARATVLGHLQRGGSPTSTDRVLATQFGQVAMKNLAEKNFGVMVGMNCGELTTTPIPDIANKQRLVGPNLPIIEIARSVGTSFGDI